MSNLFSNAQVQKLDLSNWDTSKVTDMSGMFYTDEKSPLLVITQDEKLKNYDYESNNRVGLTTKFTVNNDVTQRSVNNSEYEISFDIVYDNYQDVMKELNNSLETVLNNIEAPSEGYIFKGWALKPMVKL